MESKSFKKSIQDVFKTLLKKDRKKLTTCFLREPLNLDSMEPESTMETRRDKTYRKRIKTLNEHDGGLYERKNY